MNSKTPLFYNNLPEKAGAKLTINNIYGASLGFTITQIIETALRPILLITKDIATSSRLKQELEFFARSKNAYPIINFPDWETLPYDHFSPHQDIISERLATLYALPNIEKGAVIISVNTLMQYLLPRGFLEAHSFVLTCGDSLNPENFCARLAKYGYRAVGQVLEHGEFARRGSLLDIFPMGSNTPYRIDLFDETIDSLRIFDLETQISTEKINAIRLLPAKEFPLTKEAISHFRQAWRTFFSGNPTDSALYENVSRGESAPGIEYYLKLFFPEGLNAFFDYLPQKSLIINVDNTHKIAQEFWQEIKQRYEELRYDQNRPLLPPKEIFLTVDGLYAALNNFPQIQITTTQKNPLPNLTVDHKAKLPLAKLAAFLQDTSARVLICAETAGRRESLLQLLKSIGKEPKLYANWQEFIQRQEKLGMMIAPLEQSAYLIIDTNQSEIALISEAQLFGEQVLQKRQTKKAGLNPEAIIHNLTELSIGAPVVHLEHGVGRYLGLQKIKAGAQENEFLSIEYAGQAKLYVPVTSLHLIGRYTGASPDKAPLNQLGTQKWQKIKRETIKKVRDVAVELLNIYAKRAAKKGFAFVKAAADYAKFAAGFPFQETFDQEKAIDATLTDLTTPRTMDRLICGDVGFGKTEVALRAAFLVAMSQKQVALLAPTTLLAEQHYHTFCDRFADWPIKIEMLSRFRSAKEQKAILEQLKTGAIDIIIGTHKLLQPDIIFKDLGLLVIDEEHRFGVKQKERIKALRPEVDILTLTATPIPRTLNMALSGMRDFSIITTPPPGRLSIKTFIQEQNQPLLREAILREIMRGGQVYFIHNDILSMPRIAQDLAKLVPEARLAIAHGQMRESELEKIMQDFYHQRFNLLLCTTIIESGLDIPTANTIIINRADRFGLAQLHQLRGRVGRSHHQAYAYLFTPPKKLMTQDAKKRLDAIAAMGDLGAGFVLASHDLEIRGAGELLGEEQSGQIIAVGFDLYMEYLERAVHALKKGEALTLETDALADTTEIDLQIPALLPDNYIYDVNQRLTLYKRIANAQNNAALDTLQVELIDRFGLLPLPAKNLISCTEIKLLAKNLGIRKIIANLEQGHIEFTDKPKVDAKKIIALVQNQPQHYKLKGSFRLEFKVKQKDAAELILFLKKLLSDLG